MAEKARSAQNLEFTNTNKWDTRQLVTMALMCAIAALLSFIQIPLIPGVTFLTYDPSLMPAMVCGFAFGPGAGIAVGAIAANLTIGVLFWYGSVDVILPMLLPAIVPFNLVKGTVNAVLTLIVYKAVSNLITPKKSQVKGH